MRKNPRAIFALAVVILFCTGLSAANDIGIEAFSTVELPVFPGGTDAKHHENPSHPSASVTYSLQIDYPAPDVLEFYDRQFNSRGWRPSFEVCQRNWFRPDESGGAGVAHARELFASWDHPDAHLKVKLWLSFADYRQGDLRVSCQIQFDDEHQDATK
jgi:hypothetical protein